MLGRALIDKLGYRASGMVCITVQNMPSGFHTIPFRLLWFDLPTTKIDAVCQTPEEMSIVMSIQLVGLTPGYTLNKLEI